MLSLYATITVHVTVAAVTVSIIMPGRHPAGIWIDVDSPEARFGPRHFHVLAVWVHCEAHPGGAMYFCFARGFGMPADDSDRRYPSCKARP